MKFEYVLKDYDCPICGENHDINVYTELTEGVTLKGNKYAFDEIFGYCERKFEDKAWLYETEEDLMICTAEMRAINYERRDESIKEFERLEAERKKGS